MLDRPQHDRFARDGFLGPFDLPPRFIARYAAREYVDSVQAAPKLYAGTDRGRNQHVYSRSIYELASEPSLLSNVCSLLGRDVLLWVAHMIVRSPGDRGQAWHIDAINHRVRGLHVSVAVSDNDLDNGCLQVIPGSHLYRASLSAAAKAGRLDRSDSDAVLRFADDVAPWNRPHSIVAMPLRANQYFFTWGGLWHGVGPNRTASARSAVVVRYARTDVACRDYGHSDAEIASGDPLPCILVAGEDCHGLNRIVDPPADDILGGHRSPD